MGGDGALHVLDDADAVGYIKPRPTAHGRRKNTHQVTGWGVNDETEDSNRNDKPAHSEHNDAVEGRQVVRGLQRRSTKRGIPSVHGGRNSEDKEPNVAGMVNSGGAKEGAASELNLAARAATAGDRKKNADGGRSVLLRRVAFAHDSDDNGAGESTAGGTNNAASSTDEGNSDLPYQQRGGMDGASDLEPDGDDDLQVKLHGGSTKSVTSSTMSR